MLRLGWFYKGGVSTIGETLMSENRKAKMAEAIKTYEWAQALHPRADEEKVTIVRSPNPVQKIRCLV